MKVNGETFVSKLTEWNAIKAEQDALKIREDKVREELLAASFPTPKTGTNTIDIGNGYKLKGVFKLNYKIDEAALEPTLVQMRELIGAQADLLIRSKPELAAKAYNNLTEDNKLIFGEALIITDAKPTLEFVVPKKK